MNSDLMKAVRVVKKILYLLDYSKRLKPFYYFIICTHQILKCFDHPLPPMFIFYRRASIFAYQIRMLYYNVNSELRNYYFNYMQLNYLVYLLCNIKPDNSNTPIYSSTYFIFRTHVYIIQIYSKRSRFSYRPHVV